MTEDEAPPTPEPPAPPALHSGPASGALGVALIGGAVAAAVGLLLTLPLFRRRAKARAKRKPAPPAHRPRRKRGG